MTEFTVRSGGKNWETGKPTYYAVGYPGNRVSFPTESKHTYDKAEATKWAEDATKGIFTADAHWGSFADD